MFEESVYSTINLIIMLKKVLFALLAVFVFTGCNPADTYDIIISNGLVYDGTTGIPRQADIGINVYNSGNVRLSVRLDTYEWEEVLANSDYLTIHVPFKGGKAIIGAEEIAQMKDGAVLIWKAGNIGWFTCQLWRYRL